MEANTTTGPAKNMLQFAESLASFGPDRPLELALAVFRRAGTENRFIDIAQQRSIPVYPVDERRAFDARILPRLRDVLRAFQPDVIQSHSVKSHFLVRAAGLDKSARWAAFHHGYTWPDLRMRAYNQLDRWSLRAAGVVFTVSEQFKREVVGLGVDPYRVEVVHNAIAPQWGASERSPEALRTLRDTLGIGPHQRVVLIVGRLSREKDHDTLLRAIHAVIHSPDPGRAALRPRLLIVGDGPERPAILDTARRLGISSSLAMTGHVSSAAAYYGIADVAVLSSLSEGSPNALLEAMAARVPIVATSVGGIPEMASHGRTALLVPPRDPQAMGRAIAEVLENRTLGLSLADAAYRHLLANYSPATRTERLIGMYFRLLHSPAGIPEAA